MHKSRNLEEKAHAAPIGSLRKPAKSDFNGARKAVIKARPTIRLLNLPIAYA